MVTEIVSVRLHKSPVPECRPKTKGQKTADKSAHIHSMAFLDNSRHATARPDYPTHQPPFRVRYDKRPRQRLQQQRMPWSCAMQPIQQHAHDSAQQRHRPVGISSCSNLQQTIDKTTQQKHDSIFIGMDFLRCSHRCSSLLSMIFLDFHHILSLSIYHPTLWYTI